MRRPVYGTLGRWTGDPVDIELKPDAQPCHARPYPVPKCHQDTLRNEVGRLVEIGVLKKVNHSEWGAPSFIIGKKDGTVRFINDFRMLNQRIKRKPYPSYPRHALKPGRFQVCNES